MGSIRIFIVDNNPEWLKLLVTFLYDFHDLLVVGMTQKMDIAVSEIQKHKPDIVLLGINNRGKIDEGIQTTLEIRKSSQAKVMILTVLEIKSLIIEAFLAGAADCISKCHYKRIPQKICEVYGRKTPTEILAEEFTELKRNQLLSVLSNAEREVFELIEQGHTQSQIQKILFKSERTIKNQVNQILKKLQVKSSREAIQKVKRLEL